MTLISSTEEPDAINFLLMIAIELPGIFVHGLYFIVFQVIKKHHTHNSTVQQQQHVQEYLPLARQFYTHGRYWVQVATGTASNRHLHAKTKKEKKG